MPYRGLCACHEVCPVRDCSAPVVPRQEEFSGAATGFAAEEKGYNGESRAEWRGREGMQWTDWRRTGERGIKEKRIARIPTELCMMSIHQANVWNNNAVISKVIDRFGQNP